ncbi:MAG: Zn-ribbon domain-containing OB-fold protein, partial [Gammaproteobacteria bacterium]
RWTPAPICPYCQAEDCTWAPVSGRGRIHTWTLITHPVHPAAVKRVPYVVVEVALDEQADLRMIGNLVDADPQRIAFDAPVGVVFETNPSGQKLPVFRLIP